MMQYFLVLASSHWLALLVGVNSLSFCLARFISFLMGGLKAKLRVIRPAGINKRMYYLVPGCLNQGETAFGFLLSGKLTDGITLVNYRSMWGCNFRTITKQVIRHVEQHDYRPFVAGIAIGDYVARGVTSAISGTQSVAINPEPDSRILLPWVRVATRVGSILALALTVILGWFSIIPWCNVGGNRFSLAFIADQLYAIAFTPGVTKELHRLLGVRGVIISQRPTSDADDGDGFLCNFEIKRYFHRRGPIIKIATGHGETVTHADKYLKAWQEIIAKTDQPGPE